MDTNKDFLEKLKVLKLQNDEELRIIEVTCKEINDTQVIEPLFRLLENNPNYYFGNPGNIVRILEKFSDEYYIPALYNSIKRKPTEYNLWMLNRLLNSFDNEQKTEGMNLLTEVFNTNEDEKIKKLAKEFLDEQEV